MRTRDERERACDYCGATLRVDPTYEINVHNVVRIACAACGFRTFSSERWALDEARAIFGTTNHKKAAG